MSDASTAPTPAWGSQCARHRSRGPARARPHRKLPSTRPIAPPGADQHPPLRRPGRNIKSALRLSSIPASPTSRANSRRLASARVTFLIYLNDDYEGGATAFPRLDWSFKGAQDRRRAGVLERHGRHVQIRAHCMQARPRRAASNGCSRSGCAIARCRCCSSLTTLCALQLCRRMYSQHAGAPVRG
jgi:hypothetical protein